MRPRDSNKKNERTSTEKRKKGPDPHSQFPCRFRKTKKKKNRDRNKKNERQEESVRDGERSKASSRQQ